MGDRRMFSKTIVDSDAFLDMPLSTQALYFHLAMRADDEGFVNNPKRIQRLIGSSDDDLKVLFAKRFILGFQSGVIVIKHWKIHNYIQSDRFHETTYTEEKALIKENQNKSYSYADEDLTQPCIHDGYGMDTQLELNKLNRLNSLNKLNNISAPETDAEVEIISQNDSWFTAFWKEYPKKKDKAQAYKAFSKVCKTEETYNAIMTGLINQIPLWPDYQYIPYPSSWLNGKRWEDDLSKDKQKKQGFNVPFPEVYEEE